jgi:serine/threonine-protein kinase
MRYFPEESELVNLMISGMTAPRRGAMALCLALALATHTALAQERDPAAAQALFDQARELTSQGRYAEACPKLQESNRLDPGIGTQFHLADCYEQSGRVASAWAAFLDVASQARASGQLDREKAATKRADKLQPRLPRLLVNVPDASKAPGIEIRRNGVSVGVAQWGTPLPVDPGEVELTTTAPGKKPLHQSLRLEEGRTASYVVPPLEAAEAGPAPVTTVDGAPPGAGEQPAVTTRPGASSATPAAPAGPERRVAASSSRPWILSLAGLGVVGVGVGTAFGLMAKSKYDDSKAECEPDDLNTCSAAGVGLRNDARTRGNVATVSFIVGGAALAGAGIVWLASGRGSETHAGARRGLRAAPALGPRSAALLVQGSF